MPRLTDDATAYAANWRTVLAVDAAIGLALAAAGVVLLVLRGAGVVGALLVAAGAAYATLVARRYRRWRRLRTAAGLP